MKNTNENYQFSTLHLIKSKVGSIKNTVNLAKTELIRSSKKKKSGSQSFGLILSSGSG